MFCEAVALLNNSQEVTVHKSASTKPQLGHLLSRSFLFLQAETEDLRKLLMLTLSIPSTTQAYQLSQDFLLAKDRISVQISFIGNLVCQKDYVQL